MARHERSEWCANRHLALGAVAPRRKPKPLPMRSRASQRAALWAMGLLALLWGGAVLLH